MRATSRAKSARSCPRAARSALQRCLALTAVIAGLGAAPVLAATWRVEQDGSGDWQTLQQAADAAASGDTILVGAGRYEGVAISPLSPAHYVKSLTFIGDQVDSVVIGPVAYEHRSGMLIYEDAPQHFRNLTLENLSTGIEFRGGTIAHCRFSGCRNGVDLQESSIGSSVTDCTFAGIGGTMDIGNALHARHVTDVLMEGCQATDMLVTAYFVDSYVIRNCTFPKAIANVGLDHFRSNGTLEDCRISGRLSVDEGTLAVRRCDLSVNDGPGIVTVSCGAGELLLEGCVVHGGADGEPNLFVGSGGRVQGSGNDILKGVGAPYVVSFSTRSLPGGDCDLRNNYWGTADADTLRAWIRDADDDPGLVYRVLFEPFSTLPLPAARRSLASVKAMFR